MLHIKIKNLRENHGFTQKQVADLLGVTRSTYSYYESGRILPSIPIIIRLSELYLVSCDYLIKNGKECDNMDDLLNEVCKKERELLCYFRMIPTCIQDEIIDVIKKIYKKINFHNFR